MQGLAFRSSSYIFWSDFYVLWKQTLLRFRLAGLIPEEGKQLHHYGENNKSDNKKLITSGIDVFQICERVLFTWNDGAKTYLGISSNFPFFCMLLIFSSFLSLQASEVDGVSWLTHMQQARRCAFSRVIKAGKSVAKDAGLKFADVSERRVRLTS